VIAFLPLSVFVLSKPLLIWMRALGVVSRNNTWIDATLDRLALMAFALCVLYRLGPTLDLLECICR
jgi:hypothetical protein